MLIPSTCQRLLVSLAIVGCLAVPALAARRAGFRFINRGELNTLDPNRMSWAQDIRIGQALWEGLYALQPDTLEPIPGVAQSLDLTPDKLTYTFHLRPDAKWSNGDVVTSADFIFAWRRMLQEPGDYTYLFHYISGAEAYEKAFADSPASADFKTVGITAPDPATLVVKLDHPVAFMLDLCAFPSFFPLNEKSMAAFKQTAADGRMSYSSEFTRPPNLVTNGAYKLVSWQLRVGQRLEANPFYWDAKNVKTKVIEAISVDDPLLAFQKYDQGDVDWLADLSGEIASEMKKQGRTDLHVFLAFGTYFYTINVQPTFNDGTKNPLADARVRQALAMAIDKQPIVDNITRLGEPITSRYVPYKSFPTYKSPDGLPHDVARAKATLAMAGYPDGNGFPKLTLLYNTEGDHKAIAEYVRKQWEDNLGVKFELEGVESKQFSSRLHNKDYAVSRASWYGDYNDVSTFTDKYASDSLNNDSGWKNPQYDALLKQATYELDPQKRLDILAHAEDLLLTEAPIIPLYQYVNKYAFRDNVKGISCNARNMTVFKDITAGR